MADIGAVVGSITFDVVLRSKSGEVEETVGELTVPVRATADGTGTGREVETSDIEQALAGLGRAYAAGRRRIGRRRTKAKVRP